MTHERRKKLARNERIMFWVRAFLSFRILNIVISLFYIHRGLSLSQIFYLSLFWAAAGLLFEVPSSYLADRWGRKKTILLGLVCMTAHWVLLFVAQGFAQMAAAVIFYGVAFACFSGTDEALIYDSHRELGREKESLGMLGRYQSAQYAFKIATVLVGALIARNLTDGQFSALIILDIAATAIAFVIALRLTEPRHFMDLERMEAGVMRDAVSLLRREPLFFRAIAGREMIFFSIFIVWLYFQKFFVDLGLTILVIGIMWSVKHAVSYALARSTIRFVRGSSIARRLNQLSGIEAFLFALFLAVYAVYRESHLLLVLFLVMGVGEAVRRPLYSEFFNKRILSYNRATTLSLANLMHNLFEFPVVLIAGLLVAVHPIFPFVFGFVLTLFAFLFVRLPREI